MLLRDEVEERLRSASSRPEHLLFFAALLRAEAEVPAGEFFVVGGSAIEIYTSGRYSSGDIDLVSARGERVRGVLRRWGFEREGRIWVNERLQLVVDVNNWPYTGDVAHTTTMATPFGPVQLASVEDLIVKRLASAKWTKLMSDREHAKLLVIEFGDALDWTYLERFAAEKDVLDWLIPLRNAVERSGKRRSKRSP